MAYDDFESGELKPLWTTETTGGTITVVGAAAKNGSYGCRFTTDGVNDTQLISITRSGMDEPSYDFFTWARTSDCGSDWAVWVYIRDVDGGTMASLRIWHDEFHYYWQGGDATFTTTPLDNTWYKLRVVVDNPGNKVSFYIYDSNGDLLESDVDKSVSYTKNIGGVTYYTADHEPWVTTTDYDDTVYGPAEVSTLTKTFTADSILVNRLTKTFTADAFLQSLGLTKTFTADAFLQAAFSKTFEADAILKGTYLKTFTADSVLVNRLTKTFTADGILKVTLTKTFTADAYLQTPGLTKTFTTGAILISTIPIIVSPKDAAAVPSPVYMVATSSIYDAGGGKKHFLLQVDKTNVDFQDIELEANSYTSQTNWEFWDGDSWEPMPAAGLDSAYFENDVRYNATLTPGNKWWRIKELNLTD